MIAGRQPVSAARRPRLLDDILPVALSLAAGVLFAFGTQFIGVGLRHTDPQSGTLLDIGTSALIYWLLVPFFIPLEYWLSAAAVIFAATGLFRPVLSANLAARGVRHLGPTLASSFSTTTPLFAAGYGVFLLGEDLTLPVAAGTLAIVGSLVMLLYRSDQVKASWPIWAMLFPLGAAFLRSTGNSLTKVGLDMLASPLFAGLLGYTVSLIVALGAQRARRAPRLPDLRASPGALWFAVAGACHAGAVFAMNWALELGEIIVVVPIVSIYPFFTLALSLLVFRRDRLDRRTLLAVPLVVGGVLLITLTR